MQAVESETLILYHTDLRGQWPEGAAQAFAARLPYARRLALRASRASDRASLAGVALAVRALGRLLGRTVGAGEIVFARGHKPHLACPAERALAGVPRAARAVGAAAPAAAACAHSGAWPDFSISHAAHWVGCAAVACGRVGFDIELGTDARQARWVLLEAALKATGEGVRALPAARQLRAVAGRMRWRDELWQVERLEQFAGAVACVVASHAARRIDARAVALEELFAP
jgi:hypothetical protein